MAADRLAARMRALGVRICGDCAYLKEWNCTAFRTPVPTMGSDPACLKYLPKRK